MLTFNYANIRAEENGKTFLDLEIQAMFQGQTIIIRNTFPATNDFQSSYCQHKNNCLQDDGNHNEKQK